MVFWEGYVSDEVMGTFAPIVVYWLYAGFYQLLPPMDKYRLHTRKEENAKNLVPLASVVKGVLLQQFFQATVAHLLFLVNSSAVSVPVCLGHTFEASNKPFVEMQTEGCVWHTPSSYEH
ncbi:hypothetical protein KY290_022155 [Solanum tuberosum]|uniref:Uncharacterized protein n=1 Tax=Solanum tuberosum TaxID=4113 RepID=A0ABQ7V5M2_SOLTU|nr:hypothetical protein KY290_022155 [Solanum tuberosum]